MSHQRHRQTDDVQSQDHALHYSVSRGKNQLFEFGVALCGDVSAVRVVGSHSLRELSELPDVLTR